MTMPGDSVAVAPELHRLLPLPGLAAYACRDFGAAPPLHPEERACIARAAPRRIAEFTAGRACARRALADLGIPDFALRMGADRAPLWPPGIVGSITHCPGYCAAVAIPASACSGIGIDAEQPGTLDADAEASFCTVDERAWLARHAPDARARAATALFSAKEAVVKALAGAARPLPDFRAIAIRLERDHFTATLAATGPTRSAPLQGRCAWHDGHILCSIALPPTQRMDH